MKFLYTIDPNATEPIMCIDTHIGEDEEEGCGIMGDLFVKELLFLDTLGKSKINIWISSPGGSVTDGMAIANAILKTKTKIDTHAIGMVASIAVPIFEAGRTRKMMDNSFLMVHNPWGSENNKALDTMKDSIVTLISERSGISKQMIEGLMSDETWLMAEKCLLLGLCDEVESSGEIHKPRKVASQSDFKAVYKEYKTILNKAVEKIKNNDMKTIKNHFKLEDSADEAVVLAKVVALEKEAAEAKNRVQDKEKEMKDAVDAAEARFQDLKQKYDKFLDEKNKADSRAQDEAKNKLEADGKALVKEAVDAGKIVNEEKVIADWEKQATASVEGFNSVKNMIATLPINKKAPTNVVNKFDNKDGVVKYNSASIMADIAIKNKQI